MIKIAIILAVFFFGASFILYFLRLNRIVSSLFIIETCCITAGIITVCSIIALTSFQKGNLIYIIPASIAIVSLVMGLTNIRRYLTDAKYRKHIQAGGSGIDVTIRK